MKKLLLALMCLLCTTASAMQFASQSVLVVDDRNNVLFEKQPDQIMPIASLTKLMTGMIVLDAHQDMNEMITITEADRDILKHSMSRVHIGSTITRADALQLALMSSDNRAAAALGRTYPGGLSAFQTAVNAKITELGLTNTTIIEPSGLSPYNVSTARDLVKIAIAASWYPEIVRMTTDTIKQINIRGRLANFKNTNRYVGTKDWVTHLSKTGYIEEAGRCLIMRITAGGKTAIMVLLNAGSSSARFQDALNIRRAMAGEEAPRPKAHKAKKRKK